MPIAAQDLVCIQEISVAGTTVYVGQIPNAALALALWAVCLRDMSVVVRLARTVFRLPAQPVPPVALAGVIPPKPAKPEPNRRAKTKLILGRAGNFG